MGLDITAYSRLKHVGLHEKDPDLNEGEPGGLNDWCYYDGHVGAFAYDCFPQSFRGIPVLGEKTGHDYRFIVGGCYEITDETERIDFRAGSYTGYGRWRVDLRRQFVVPDPDPESEPPSLDVPFYELIWFADNEGSIGPDAAADLLADFREHADRYVLPEAYASYPAIYDNWTRACELAADSGLIRFH